MCSNESSSNAPPKLPMPFSFEPNAPRALFPLDQYRLQLYQYAVAERLRYPLLNPFPSTLTCYPLFPRALQPEEPKPQHSYIGLIAMAILSSPESKLVLSDIYQHILDHYPYFRTRGPGWRNSIRHNLSLNDCFIKAGRSANGKGHYWAIHPANVEDFRKGDFRRRKAQRKVRKHMGLAVDEDGADSPSPPPLSVSPPVVPGPSTSVYPIVSTRGAPTRKRQFDVASLLAPDSGEDSNEEDIDVVSSDQQEKSEAKQQWPMFPIVDYYQALLHTRPMGTMKPETSTDSSNS
nr:fork head domain-containing protein FD5 [Leptinotarsa decemlineata]